MIFHKYVFEGKGSSIIANELNAAGYTSVRGAIFWQASIIRILKNEKYCGDSVQWKRYSSDLLNKRIFRNYGDNPDVPLIEIADHHEPLFQKKFSVERGGWSTNSTLKTVYQHTFSEERKLVDKKIDAYFNRIIGL